MLKMHQHSAGSIENKHSLLWKTFFMDTCGLLHLESIKKTVKLWLNLTDNVRKTVFLTDEKLWKFPIFGEISQIPFEKME